MSEIVPAVPQQSHHLEIRDHTLRSLRAVLLQLDERRQELVEEDNVEDLAAGVQDLQTILFDIRAIEYQTRIDLAEMIDRRAGRHTSVNRLEVDGVGALEVKGGWTRKGWRSNDLLRNLIAKALEEVDERIVDGMGEIREVEDSESLDAIMEALTTCLPITASLSWRTGQEKKDGTLTGLKAYGFDDEDYCERIEQPRLATVPKKT